MKPVCVEKNLKDSIVLNQVSIYVLHPYCFTDLPWQQAGYLLYIQCELIIEYIAHGFFQGPVLHKCHGNIWGIKQL